MSALELLLRDTALTHGRIALDIMGDGRWRAVVAHFNGPMTHHMGEGHADPVNALRTALIEDERKRRDLERRYHAAPKVGDHDDIADVLG